MSFLNPVLKAKYVPSKPCIFQRWIYTRKILFGTWQGIWRQPWNTPFESWFVLHRKVCDVSLDHSFRRQLVVLAECFGWPFKLHFDGNLTTFKNVMNLIREFLKRCIYCVKHSLAETTHLFKLALKAYSGNMKSWSTPLLLLDAVICPYIQRCM